MEAGDANCSAPPGMRYDLKSLATSDYVLRQCPVKLPRLVVWGEEEEEVVVAVVEAEVVVLVEAEEVVVAVVEEEVVVSGAEEEVVVAKPFVPLQLHVLMQLAVPFSVHQHACFVLLQNCSWLSDNCVKTHFCQEHLSKLIQKSSL